MARSSSDQPATAAGAGPTPSRRDDLLAKAVAHALANGVTDVSLRELARELGTSHRMLIHYFGSREGLLVEIVRTIEADQRTALAAMVAEADGVDIADLAGRFWDRLTDPALDRAERLFFEVYGQALQGRAWATPLLDGIVDDWVDAWVRGLVDAGFSESDARAEARLGVAVSRGLLLDLLATGDRAAVEGAMDRYRTHVVRTRADGTA
ncbi:MAG: helix-turn-helix domain-containing protein [Actinomycetota bacterium]|nr:helix-turn-helix domain-containing protein [Actinomycetota bacterium]